MAYHTDILKLEDEGLIRAMVLVRHHGLFDELTLTPWDRKFLDDLPTWWAKEGFITWKQRRSARSILTEITEELERRRDLGSWIDEAKGLTADA